MKDWKRKKKERKKERKKKKKERKNTWKESFSDIWCKSKEHDSFQWGARVFWISLVLNLQVPKW